jgi:hypothetical protein
VDPSRGPILNQASMAIDDTRLPLEWNEQRQRLGFASAH